MGKDTLANLFVEHEGFLRVAFADPLYDEVADAFNVTVESLRSEEWKHRPQMALQVRLANNPEFSRVVLDATGAFLDEPMTSRRILQLWATEYRRARYGEDYWVGRMIGRLRGMPGKDIIFSDLRHDIEACMGHWRVSKGMASSFKVIEILRPGAVHTGHASDHGLSKFLIDGQVRNNTTPGECFAEIKEVLAKGQESRTNG